MIQLPTVAMPTSSAHLICRHRAEVLVSFHPTTPASPPPPPPPRPLSSGTSSGTSSGAEHAQTLRDVDPTGGDALETAALLTIRPWIDPVVDDRGHDPRSRYVEIFWLGVLGPTATWLLRRLASGLEVEPDGYELDLQMTAASMGLKFSPGRSSPFSRALQRCVMFGMAHPLPGGGLAVRRRIPPVGHRHLRRMPEQLQLEHAGWQPNAGSSGGTEDAFVRAHQLAMAMLDVGDDRNVIEHQLRAVGVVSNVAAQVADNVAQLD
jgi:hypothetical protein